MVRAPAARGWWAWAAVLVVLALARGALAVNSRGGVMDFQEAVMDFQARTGLARGALADELAGGVMDFQARTGNDPYGDALKRLQADLTCKADPNGEAYQAVIGMDKAIAGLYVWEHFNQAFSGREIGTIENTDDVQAALAWTVGQVIDYKSPFAWGAFALRLRNGPWCALQHYVEEGVGTLGQDVKGFSPGNLKGRLRNKVGKGIKSASNKLIAVFMSCKTVAKALADAEKLPVVRYYAKKMRFLKNIAETIGGFPQKLQEKCDNTKWLSDKLDFVIKLLGWAQTAAKVLGYWILPTFRKGICAFNQITAKMSVFFNPTGRRLEGGGEPSALEHVRSGLSELPPHLRTMMGRWSHLHREALGNMSASDLLQHDDRRRALKFQAAKVDDFVAAIAGVVGVFSAAKDVVDQIERAAKDVVNAIVLPAEKFIGGIMLVLSGFGTLLEPFQPIFDFIAKVADALSSIKCPDALGFVS
jgi:hypothetical protein